MVQEIISKIKGKKLVLCQSVSLKPHSLECGQHFEHPKIEHLFKPRLLSRGGASIFLFGETHGTKEIPELLLNLFSDLAKNEDFNLGLEISDEFQNLEPDKILSSSKEIGTGGLISNEYIKLIKEMPKNIKVLFIAPNSIKNQEEMEKEIADNILKLVDDKRIFVILGNIHASKNKIEMGNLEVVPAGFLIYQRLKDEMCSVLLKPKSGEFFNNGVRQAVSNEDDFFDKNFDYVYELDNVSPCSF